MTLPNLLNILRAASVVLLVMVGSAQFRLSGQSLIHKCSPGLQHSVSAQGESEIYVIVRDTNSFYAHLASVSGGYGQLRNMYRPAQIVQVHVVRQSMIDTILAWPEVLYIDRVATVPKEELPVPGQNLTLNRINALHQHFPDFDGKGITVSVKESRFDSTDVDLLGRVRPNLFGSNTITIHASTMASLIGGAGTSDRAGLGVAPGVGFVTSDFAVLLPDEPIEYAQQEVSVQNHSYGVGIENYYGADAMAYDASVVERPELVHVFSAGNRGAEASALGTYQQIPGYANLTGSFKMAKNVLTVGAVDSFARVVPFSSHGPAYDGRVKPDLVAFGQDGSSGAAALVSGTAAVLQQAFAAAHNSRLPPAALVRSVLINSARDIDPPGPDFASGFGCLRADHALQNVITHQYWLDSISNGANVTFLITVPPGQAKLRATLVWDDPPAMAGSPGALINDLDLKLIGPDGSTDWMPWRLHTEPFADSLGLPATRAKDSLNNVEQISLDHPTAGPYTLVVEGRRVSGRQVFALAYEWEKEAAFSWTFPLFATPPLTGHEALLQWEYVGPSSTGRLEYRMDPGGGWQLIDSAVALPPGFYRWSPPGVAALGQVRMTINGLDYPSDTFCLAPEIRVRVGFDCPDSVMLYWNGAGPGMQFQLWGLGTRYLEPLFIIADTFVVLPRQQYPQSRFAVSPRSQAGLNGWRSGAPAVDNQGVACYFSSFLAELNALNQVDLQLSVGTTYGIHDILIERQEGADFYLLNRWSAPFQNNTFASIDANPDIGINRYRARLLLESGVSLLSDTVAVYFTGNSKFVVFPNPNKNGQPIQIIAPDLPDSTSFCLYNYLGQLVVEDNRLKDALSAIPIPALPPGSYPFVIRSERAILKRGIMLLY